MKRLCPTLALLVLAAVIARAESSPPRSPRNANYTIEVTLDPDARLLTGRQVVRWRNREQQPTRELRFHLYWNAWRNDQSTWMREDRYRERRALEEPGPEDWGYVEVESARLGEVDLLPGARFLALDDGNAQDRTVWRLQLPAAVLPGGEIALTLRWRARVPSFFARTGVRGDFYFIAHWFPALGVFETGGWNCHQFHAATEFFSDYGAYDVTITLPSAFVVGATGRERERRDHGDGTTSHRYLAEDVHTFAWTASPHYVVIADGFAAEGLPPVDLRLLLQPEHRAQAERHLAATKAALELYGRWYGPYPYPTLTVVDPAWSSDAGGMEYPTMFTAGTRRWNPPAGGEPEGVTIHEAGHQFWYGIVGNDEFEHAWLDEGINTFSEERALAEVYGEPALVHRFFAPPGLDEEEGFFPVLLPGYSRGGRVHLDRLDNYRPHATSDVQRHESWRYDPASGRRLTYNKTSLWLGTLERRFGWETLRAVLATFFARGSFGHPTPDDFLHAARAVGGTEFADAVTAFLTDDDFDYAVQSAVSVPAEASGLVEEEGALVLREPEDPTPETAYRSEVVVRRHGSGAFPV
ncbi:MAG: M1 family metallopeptidase, partial [Thermoanaerobaculia bacterium]